ncbi:MAG: PUA domain-containing protein [Nitrososphaerota archaeon]
MVRLVADYQFGHIGALLFPDRCRVGVSPSSGRPRSVWLDGKLIASVKLDDGLITLTLDGGRILASIVPPPKYRVAVSYEAAYIVAKGRSVFSKHLIRWDGGIIPGQEVLVEDPSGRLIAVGKAVLSGDDMGRVGRGVAVKVRSSVGRNSSFKQINNEVGRS